MNFQDTSELLKTLTGKQSHPNTPHCFALTASALLFIERENGAISLHTYKQPRQKAHTYKLQNGKDKIYLKGSLVGIYHYQRVITFHVCPTALD